MELVLLGVLLLALLGLNAFFVLAEFAIVKVRPSRVAELVASGSARAVTLGRIQAHLDEYLGVCQVGITLASVALGMVGKKTADALLGAGDHGTLRYVVAFGLSYLVVSGSHIVLGEQFPKFVGIRAADRAALFCASPLRVFRLAFFPVLWVLTALTNGLLRLIGLSRPSAEEHHSEEELKILLDQGQERGLLSFRRLLFIENVFDLGELTVADAMRPRSVVRCLDARLPWKENLHLIRASRYTRYPLITGAGDRPVGFVHLKDLVIDGVSADLDLRSLVRPIVTVRETTPLESVLAELQRRRIHAALVVNRTDQWTGFITLEDVIEELVGTIRDEFEDEEPIRLADALTVERVHLGVPAESSVGAVKAALERMSPADLPLPAEQLWQAVQARGRLPSTYLGEGIGLPAARVPGLLKPFLMVIRPEQSVVCEGTSEPGKLLLVLLTPAGQPRVHQRLQTIIVNLLHESDYVKDRLLTATTPDEVLEAVRTGEQASLG